MLCRLESGKNRKIIGNDYLWEVLQKYPEKNNNIPKKSWTGIENNLASRSLSNLGMRIPGEILKGILRKKTEAVPY